MAAQIHHVLNGDALVDGFAATRLSGQHTVWREVLIDGPVAVDMSEPGIASARARWLTSELGIVGEDYLADFEARERTLAALAELGEGRLELVLWFERDLFCEVHLLELLGRTSLGGLARADVSVVHPQTLVLEPSELVEAFELRRRCTAAERGVARIAWRAWADPDARAFEALDLREGPWIDELIDRMQTDRRLLFADDRGLTAIEAKALELLREHERPLSPVAIFRAVAEDEALGGLGLGDMSVFLRVEWMAARGLIELDEPLQLGEPSSSALGRPIVRASASGIAALERREVPRARPRGWVGGARCGDWRIIDGRLQSWD